MRYEPGIHAAPGQIPLSVPEIRGNEWTYVKQCLDSGWVSSAGKFIEHFEQRCAEQIGRKYGVAVCNGTSALHVALRVAGVGGDDEVLVSDLTFIAPAFAIRYVGAWPVFIDVEPDYWQMDPQRVADFLDRDCRAENGRLVNKLTGRTVKAIVPVHILGHPIDLQPILDLAGKYNLLVIEDAAEAMGAKYRGRPVGSGGEGAALSFNGNKIVTCGGGGVFVTDRKDWAEKARYLTTQAKDDPIEFVHNEIGYNYRLTNIQAAVGLGQMEKLDEFVSIKRQIAENYRRAFEKITGIAVMKQADWAFSTFWLYTILINPVKCKVDRREAMRQLAGRGIQSRPLWQPMHLNGCFKDCPPRDCPVTVSLTRDALSIPCSTGLNDRDQQKVIDSLLEILRA